MLSLAVLLVDWGTKLLMLLVLVKRCMSLIVMRLMKDLHQVLGKIIQFGACIRNVRMALIDSCVQRMGWMLERGSGYLFTEQSVPSKVDSLLSWEVLRVSLEMPTESDLSTLLNAPTTCSQVKCIVCGQNLRLVVQ